MAIADRFLLPLTKANATFWERWAGVRYVEDQLLERFHLERALLEELRVFLTPEIRERLQMQTHSVSRRLAEFDRLGHQRVDARELAQTPRELLNALRLWYAEIEFAAGGIRRSDVSKQGIQLLAELNSTRCGGPTRDGKDGKGGKDRTEKDSGHLHPLLMKGLRPW
jgi:hypothetical protein